jgi:dTDP-4-dehydrorhamnose reductase
MKLLITGGEGQIATAMANCVPSAWRANFLSHSELDISDEQAVKSIITQSSPDVIINTAAFTAVDFAEKNPPKAFQVNHKAVAVLASACAKEQIPLIHLSTDYVFDGQKTSPYLETDIPNPVNIYGLSKLRGEQIIREMSLRHIILRVSSVFSPYKTNFVKTILTLAQQKAQVDVVADQQHCPTSAEAVAAALYAIVRGMSDGKWGTYHYCGSPSTTWHAFCEKIFQLNARHTNQKMPIAHPVSSDEFGAVALRPRYSVLDCDKIRNDFGVLSLNWEDDLDKVIKAIQRK